MAARKIVAGDILHLAILKGIATNFESKYISTYFGKNTSIDLEFLLYNIIHMENPGTILFITPKSNASQDPVIDEATKKMTAAVRKSKLGRLYRRPDEIRGIHNCVCGIMSAPCDYILPDGARTNSLCVHYLAYHHDEVPKKEMEKVLNLQYGEIEPTAEEMRGTIKTENTEELKYRPRFKIR